MLGIGDNEYFLASDVPAFLEYTKKVIFIEDNEMIAVNDTIDITNFVTGKKLSKKIQTITYDISQARKGDYEHFMLKEIHEQSRVIRDTLAEYLEVAEPVIDPAMVPGGRLEDLTILACGTSYHAALAASYLFYISSRPYL